MEMSDSPGNPFPQGNGKKEEVQQTRTSEALAKLGEEELPGGFKTVVGWIAAGSRAVSETPSMVGSRLGANIVNISSKLPAANLQLEGSFSHHQ